MCQRARELLMFDNEVLTLSGRAVKIATIALKFQGSFLNYFKNINLFFGFYPKVLKVMNAMIHFFLWKHRKKYF